MNDLIDSIHHEDDILLDGTSLYDPSVEVISLRKRVGMVFQKYNPFPKAICENIVFALRVAGRNRKAELDEVVERSLRSTAHDPMATFRMEQLMHELQQEFAFVIVTHNMHQATRVSDRTASVYPGEPVEEGATDRIFSTPKQRKTEEYTFGRFG